MGNEFKKNEESGLSRRDVLKAAAAGLVAGVVSPFFPKLNAAMAAETGAGGTRVLTVFFSHTGSTRAVANHIHDIIGDDMVELETVQAYPADYEEIKKQAMQELNSGFLPKLKATGGDLSSYTTIFVGTPVWWGTTAPPVRTFLSGYDLSGKTIIPFTTHLGSGLGRCPSDIAALCPNSTMRGGLAVWGRSAKDARGNVADWLEKLGLKAS